MPDGISNSKYGEDALDILLNSLAPQIEVIIVENASTNAPISFASAV
jgi:hypothetical protein